MANKTTNLQLTQPLPEEFYDISIQNENMDKIDAAISGHAVKVDNPHQVTAAQVGADATGTAAGLVAAHDGDAEAHGDIREAIKEYVDKTVANAVPFLVPFTMDSTGNWITEGPFSAVYNTSVDLGLDVFAQIDTAGVFPNGFTIILPLASINASAAIFEGFGYDQTGAGTRTAYQLVLYAEDNTSFDMVQLVSANDAATTYAPAYTYGTTDLIVGTSPLGTGKLYFVYE